MECAHLIVDGLWLGDAKCAANVAFLTSNHITLVVNCTDRIPTPSFYEQFHISTVRLPLNNHDMLSNFWVMKKHAPRVRWIIFEALKKGHNILVHCAQGRHRSAALVVFYLMKHVFRNNYNRSVDLVKRQRPIAFTPKDYFRPFLQPKTALHKPLPLFIS